MSFSPNPLRFRIKALLGADGEITFADSFAFVKYNPRPPREDDTEDDCEALPPSAIAVVSAYIGSCGEADPEWWPIDDIQEIGPLRLARLRFRGSDFGAALRANQVRNQDLLLLDALIDGFSIQLHVHVDGRPSALFLNVVSG